MITYQLLSDPTYGNLWKIINRFNITHNNIAHYHVPSTTISKYAPKGFGAIIGTFSGVELLVWKQSCDIYDSEIMADLVDLYAKKANVTATLKPLDEFKLNKYKWIKITVTEQTKPWILKNLRDLMLIDEVYISAPTKALNIWFSHQVDMELNRHSIKLLKIK
jgi:hypothetical protein